MFALLSLRKLKVKCVFFADRFIPVSRKTARWVRRDSFSVWFQRRNNHHGLIISIKLINMYIGHNDGAGVCFSKRSHFALASAIAACSPVSR